MNKFTAKKLKEFDEKELGCCGGDYCPHYENFSMNHTKHLKAFLTQTIKETQDKCIEEIDNYKDFLEHVEERENNSDIHKGMFLAINTIRGQMINLKDQIKEDK